MELRIEALAEKLDALERENKILREENAILKRGLFGRRTERLEPGQLRIFEDVTDEEPAVTPEPCPMISSDLASGG